MEKNRNAQSSNSLRDTCSVLFRYKKAMALTFCLVLAVGGLILLCMTPVYEAKSSLLLKTGREYLNKSDLNATAPMISLAEAEATNSEIQILTNQISIGKVIQRIGVQRIYPDLEKSKLSQDDRLLAATDRFVKDLTVEPVKQSRVIQVSFKHSDPQVAAEAVNLLVELFKEKHLQVFSGGQQSLVEAELARYRQKLDQSEEKLTDFKQKNKVYSLEEQRTLLLGEHATLDAALKATDASIRELEDKVPALKASLSQMGHSFTPNTQPDKEAAIEATKAQLLELKLEEQKLLKTYTETSPLVVSQRKQIAVVQNYLKGQEKALTRATNLGGPQYQGVEMELVKAKTDLASLRARAESLRGQLARTEAEVQNLDLQEKALQQLKTEQAVNQKSYETMVTKLEEARISESMDRNKLVNISVIEEASAPVDPVAPKKGEYLLRCLVLAIVGSLGIPFVLQNFSSALGTPESVERRLGLKVLGSISHTERS